MACEKPEIKELVEFAIKFLGWEAAQCREWFWDHNDNVQKGPPNILHDWSLVPQLTRRLKEKGIEKISIHRVLGDYEPSVVCLMYTSRCTEREEDGIGSDKDNELLARWEAAYNFAMKSWRNEG